MLKTILFSTGMPTMGSGILHGGHHLTLSVDWADTPVIQPTSDRGKSCPFPKKIALQPKHAVRTAPVAPLL
jgi:hypothetical protein